MTAPTVSVEISFPTTPSLPVFVLDDPVKGKLNNATYKLAGANVSVDISNITQQISIRRGRTRALDQYEPGTATIVVRDLTGAWNPQNTSSPYYPNIQIRRPIKITAALDGVGYSLFTGLTQSYRYDYDKSNNVAWVTLECSDLLSQFAQLNISSVTGSAAGQTTGTRIGLLLDQISTTLPTTNRSIDTGSTVMQADTGQTRSVQTAIQEIVDTELGAFFVKADGTLRFVDRSNTIKESLYQPVVFSDSGAGVRYLDLRLAFDDTLLANQVTVTPNGLAAQTANNTASQTSFGIRSLTRTTYPTTTGDAFNQASYLVAQRGTPALRCEAIVLDTWSGGTQAVQALTLDFLDAVTVNHSHIGTATTFPVYVQGVDHDISPGSWITTLRVAEAAAGFVLDYSKLDTGVLTY